MSVLTVKGHEVEVTYFEDSHWNNGFYELEFNCDSDDVSSSDVYKAIKKAQQEDDPL